jgi:hypothetical protein
MQSTITIEIKYKCKRFFSHILPMKSIANRPLEHLAYGGGNTGIFGKTGDSIITKLPVSEKESPKLKIAL